MAQGLRARRSVASVGAAALLAARRARRGAAAGRAGGAAAPGDHGRHLGCSYPWDLTWVGSLMLFDQRGGTRLEQARGRPHRSGSSISGFPSLFVNGEGGLLGMVADPGPRRTGSSTRARPCAARRVRPLDVRVLRWRLTSDTTAVSDGAPVVTGLPLTSGRHSGCRLRFGADGNLYVGTGDAADGHRTRRTSPRSAARCCASTGTARSRRTTPSTRPRRQRPLRVELRPPQHPGPRAAARHQPSCGRRSTAPTATTRSTSRSRAQLRLGPRARLRRVHPDDRPREVPDSPPGDVVLGLPHRRHERRRPSSRPRPGASGSGALAVALLKDEGIDVMRFDPSPDDDRRRVRHPAAGGAGLRPHPRPAARARRLRCGSRRRTAATTRSCGSGPRPRPSHERAAGTLVSPSAGRLARTGTR